MRTTSQLLNLATNLSNNTSANNQSLALTLMSEQQRLLLEKFFDNETSFSTTTIGAMTTLVLTGLPASGAISATLTVAWAYASGQQRVYFTNPNADSRVVQFTNNSTALTWQEPLSSAVTSTAISTGGFQRYRIPAGISKITNSTIMVGQLKFVPAPVQTRTQWDNMNFLPYPSDIPNYFFLYGGYVEFWPVPSTTGNTITFNYKTRVPDLSTAFLFSDVNGAAYVAGQTTFDYQKGTIAGTINSDAITGTTTGWNTTGKFPLGVDITQFNLGLMINPPFGDGFWYPIQQFTSDTALVLATPIMNAPNIAGATYSIGQLPLLQEDFHETIVYGYLQTYFSSIAPDGNKFKQFNEIYQSRLKALGEYAGEKTVNYNLGERPTLLNPNNYPFYPGSVNSP